MQDRCRDNALAPGASCPTFELRPTEAAEVVGAPVLAAGEDGYGRATIRCRAPGEVRLFSEDKLNPKDSTNLLTGTIEARRPQCGDFSEEPVL